jgi:hypothetical protein
MSGMAVSPRWNKICHKPLQSSEFQTANLIFVRDVKITRLKSHVTSSAHVLMPEDFAASVNVSQPSFPRSK